MRCQKNVAAAYTLSVINTALKCSNELNMKNYLQFISQKPIETITVNKKPSNQPLFSQTYVK